MQKSEGLVLNKHVKIMLTEVTIWNLLLGGIIAVFMQYALHISNEKFAAGLFIASISFILIGISSQVLIKKGNGLSVIVLVLLYYIKIIFISYIAYVIYRKNLTNVAYFISGYLVSLTGVIIYAMKRIKE